MISNSVRKKKITYWLIVVCLVASFLVISSGYIYAGKKYTFRVGSVNYPAHHVTRGVDKWCELVKKKSGGDITILHFPASQLGSGKETFEACRAGYLDFAADSCANIVTLSRAFEVLHLPYMFETEEQLLRAIDSPKVKAMIEEVLSEVNLKWIQTFSYGFRKVAAQKEIRVPSDLQGIKVRVSRSPSEIAPLKKFGAAPVTIDWGETFTALKTGVITGINIPFVEYYTGKVYEVIGYVCENSDTNWVGQVTVVNKKKWEAFPEEVRNILMEAAEEAQEWHRKLFLEQYIWAWENLIDQGVKVYRLTPEQREIWIRGGKETWAQFEKEAPPDIIQVVREAAGLSD